MKIEFYANTSDPRKAVKSIGDVIHTINDASVYRECSLMNPEFLINYSPIIAACNYIYAGVTIEDVTYGAYYFIRDRIVMPGGKAVIICAKDVLSTWWHRLKDCRANIVRQEQQSNMSRYMFDEKRVMTSFSHVSNIPFDGGNLFINPSSTQHCFVMTVLGGEPNNPPSEGS